MRGLFSVIAIAASVTLAACGGSSSSMGPYNSGGTGGTGGGGGSTSNAISVGNDFYNPSSTTVAVGTTVTWTWNSGGNAHTVNFDDGAQGSGVKTSGTFSRTFGAAGTFTYHCQIHGVAMSGTVKVQ